MTPVSYFWTDERVERLTKMWLDGSSAGEIANELGGVTRNAVIGIVHRRGLAKRDKKALRAPRELKLRRSRATRPARVVQSRAATHHAAPEPELESEPLTDVTDIDIPMAQRCGLLDLTSYVCHWPVGDPTSADFYFCGGSSVTGRPYCWAHTRIAYQPAQPRRRGPEWRPYR